MEDLDSTEDQCDLILLYEDQCDSMRSHILCKYPPSKVHQLHAKFAHIDLRTIRSKHIDLRTCCTKINVSKEDWHLPLSVTSESIELSVTTRRFFCLVPITCGFLKAILTFNSLEAGAPTDLIELSS